MSNDETLTSCKRARRAADDPELHEYVGALSFIGNEQCGEFPERDDGEIKQCGDDATHSVVLFDGNSLITVSRCNEHGEPDDVDVHDREWSGKVEL